MLMPQYIASSRECASPAAVVAPAHADATAASAAESVPCPTAPAGAAKPSTIAVRDTATPIPGRPTRCPFGGNHARSSRQIYIYIRISYAYSPKSISLGPAGSVTYLVEGLRVLQRGEISLLLAQNLGPNGPAHDLGASGLRQGGHEHDPLGPERLSKLVSDRGRDLERAGRGRLGAGLQHAEDPGDLAFHVVWDADRGSFGDPAVTDGRGLELSRADALAGDVERVVGASVQVPVTVLVDRRPVAVRPDPGEAPPVRVQVTLLVTPDAARHSRPRAFADELAHLAAYGRAVRSVHVHVLAEGRKAECDRLDRLRDARREEAGAYLGAAGAVHDRGRAAPDLFEKPAVRVLVPRLAGRAHRLERRQVRLGIALWDQRAHECRRDAEHRHALGLDELPDPVRRKVRRALRVDDGRAARAAADNGPRPHDPTHVRGEVDAIARLDVRLVRNLACNRDEETTLDVQRSLRLTGRSRRICEQVGMLGVDLPRGQTAGGLLCELVPEAVATDRHRDVVQSEPAPDDRVRDGR